MNTLDYPWVRWHLTNESIHDDSWRLKDSRIIELAGRLARGGWEIILDATLPPRHIYAGPVARDSWGALYWTGVDPVIMAHPSTPAAINADIVKLREDLQNSLADKVADVYTRLFGELPA